jgi:hypothetical protein
MSINSFFLNICNLHFYHIFHFSYNFLLAYFIAFTTHIIKEKVDILFIFGQLIYKGLKILSHLRLDFIVI